MSTFTGTDAAETITPIFVSPTVTGDPARSFPSDGDDRLFGNGGSDTLDGGGGDDLVNGGSGFDTLDGGAGNDRMQGGSGGDTLTGGDGNDDIDGGADGDFALYVSAASRVVVSLGITTRQDTRGAGHDRLVNIENLVGSAFNDVLTGDAGANLLRGAAGDDTVDGGDGDDSLTGDDGKDTLIGGGGNDVIFAGPAGNDHLMGGTGNDIYYLFNRGDVVAELAGEGADSVRTNFSYTLADNIENLSVGGSGVQKGIGNGLANAINGYGGRRILYGMGGDDALAGGTFDDLLDGGTGADTMDGGVGDDVYIVDDTGDVAREVHGSGIDTVKASISYTLQDGMDVLLLQGAGNLNGSGNALDNTIVGTSGDNDLRGGAGNDTLEGGVGDDFLRGGVSASIPRAMSRRHQASPSACPSPLRRRPAARVATP